MDCAARRRAVESHIARLARRASELVPLALERGDLRALDMIFAAMTRLAELRGDLEMWREGECFDTGEFLSRLGAVERGLALLEERLGGGGGG